MKGRTGLVGASTPSLSWSQTNGFYKKTLTEEQDEASTRPHPGATTGHLTRNRAERDAFKGICFFPA